MNSALDRVKEEKKNLDEKIEKLGVLLGKIKSDDFPNHRELQKKMSGEQKKMLKKQYSVMKEYSRILGKRIKIWIEE